MKFLLHKYNAKYSYGVPSFQHTEDFLVKSSFTPHMAAPTIHISNTFIYFTLSQSENLRASQIY